jgi:hypothetical protein
MQPQSQPPSQSQPEAPVSARRTRRWRTFTHTDRARIEQALNAGADVLCPRCGDWLGARPGTRLTGLPHVPNGSYDLECRDCRRYHTVVPREHRYYVCIRRLATAVLHA